MSLLQPPALSISQRLWDDAYEGLANASDTSEIVEGYVKTLAKELHGQGNCDVATEMKDPTKRQMYMKKLVEDGLTKHSTLSKVSGGVGDFAGFILSAKEVVDFAVKCAPQAALPWAGVCIGLEVSVFLHSLKFSFQLRPLSDPRKPCKCDKVQHCWHHPCCFENELVLRPDRTSPE